MEADQQGIEPEATLVIAPPFPRLRHAVCLRVRCGPNFCAACRDSCPQDAMTFGSDDPLPRLNKFLCNSCGLCAAVCPVEAWNFALVEPSPSTPTRTISERGPEPDQADEPTRAVEVRCRRAAATGRRLPAAMRITIPCILGVSGGHVSAWQATAETVVCLRTGDCRSCSNGRQRSQRLRPSLLADLMPGVRVVADVVASSSETVLAEATPSWAETRMSRKSLLGTAVAAFAGAVVAKATLGRSESLPTEIGDDSQPWVREVFLTRLAREGTLKTADARLVGLGSVTVTDGGVCDGCGLCLRSCPSEALAFNDAALKLLPERCVGCGVCISRCPHGILAHAEQVDLSTLAQPVALTCIPSGRCPCGAPALPETLPQRPRCRSCTVAESLLHDLTASTRS